MEERFTDDSEGERSAGTGFEVLGWGGEGRQVEGVPCRVARGHCCLEGVISSKGTCSLLEQAG